jgi:FkbM family methyltransferase
MWVHIGNAAATKVVYGSPPDWAEMQAWARLLRPGHLFIDVGANVGTYTLWAASLGCSVIAVEPDATSVKKLRANIELNPEIEVEVLEMALADKGGEIQVTVGMDSMNHIGPGRKVRSSTLDEVVDHRAVAGVKIDVEGFEELVMQGAANTLGTAAVRAFQFEWNDFSVGRMGRDRGGLARMLESANYTLARPDASGRLWPCAAPEFGADVFAVRSDVDVGDIPADAATDR